MQKASWHDASGVSALAACLSALFSFLTLYSLYLLRKQYKSDHDRSRRERAVDLMTFWAGSQDPTNREVVFGMHLLHALTPEQSQFLWERQTFSVDPKYQNLLDSYRAASLLPCGKATKRVKSGEAGALELCESEMLMLRALATGTLNKLEMIASAWHHSIADREIIEAEFVRVFCPKDGHFVLEKFRAASGIYPCINAICSHFERKQKNVASKPQI